MAVLFKRWHAYHRWYTKGLLVVGEKFRIFFLVFEIKNVNFANKVVLIVLQCLYSL